MVREDLEMLVPVGSTKDFEEWMQQFEASLSEGVHKPLGPSEDVSTSPVTKSSLYVIDGCVVDAEQLYREDKLGCVRGVVWAMIFEAGLVIGAMVCWKLHLFAR
jgi:hypothetical protein